jgi:hypothetical protein
VEYATLSELEIESPDDERMIESYRPFSGWAIASLVLAIISVLGMINPQLFLLPLIALVVSLLTCLRNSWSKTQPIGSWLALVAALLSGFFLTSGTTYTRFRQQHYFSLARQFAETWFDLVRDGEIYRPHHLLKDWPTRQPSNVDLDQYYASLTNIPNKFKDSKIEIDDYIKQDPEKSMREFGRKMNYRYVGDFFFRDEVKTEYYQLEYVLQWPPETGRPDWPVLVEMQRKEHKQPYGNQWTLRDVIPYGEPKMFERMRRGVGLE